MCMVIVGLIIGSGLLHLGVWDLHSLVCCATLLLMNPTDSKFWTDSYVKNCVLTNFHFTEVHYSHVCT